MKTTDCYRIVDDAGRYFPQRKYAGFRGKTQWKPERVRRNGGYGESWWEDAAFDTRKAAEKWLGATITERRLEKEYARRGPIVVSEISG